MQHEMKRYVGRTVEIIYLGRRDQITQRRIEVREVKDGVVKAYCFLRRSSRVFRIENILAVATISGKWVG